MLKYDQHMGVATMLGGDFTPDPLTFQRLPGEVSTSNNDVNIDVDLHDSSVEGDLAVVWIAYHGSLTDPAITPPTGFTELFEGITANSRGKCYSGILTSGQANGSFLRFTTTAYGADEPFIAAAITYPNGGTPVAGSLQANNTVNSVTTTVSPSDVLWFVNYGSTAQCEFAGTASEITLYDASYQPSSLVARLSVGAKLMPTAGGTGASTITNAGGIIGNTPVTVPEST